MRQQLQKQLTQSEWTRGAVNTGVEAILFVSVHAVMVVCIVLVAAQLFVTA